MSILDIACYFAIVCFALSKMLTLYRGIKGPTPQDRAKFLLRGEVIEP